MASDQIANHLQILRRRSGFSQNDVEVILEIVSESQVSRHERSVSIPGLVIALGYEALFRKPVSEIFPGVYHSISDRIERRLRRIEKVLHDSSAVGRKAESIARKIEFLSARSNPELFDGDEIP